MAKPNVKSKLPTFPTTKKIDGKGSVPKGKKAPKG